MTLTEELMQAAFAAPEDRKREALTVLRGGADPRRGGGRASRIEVEPFVGLQDVAEFLGVSRRSVWRWQVPGHRFGSCTRFRLSEVAAYVESAAFRRRVDGLRAGGKVNGGEMGIED